MTVSSPQSPWPNTSKAVAYWVLLICALVAAMVVVGGMTRLTDSGLSITEWKPVTGVIPPLSAEVWQEEFEKYKAIPEYKIVNRGMTLDEFKTIFWWEWGHRFLGRLVGVVFLVPFLWFLFRKQIDRPLIPKLLFLFVLGGLQGFMGWYMVKSGLGEAMGADADRVDVAPGRLAIHLSLAFVIFGYGLWVALDILRGVKAWTAANKALAIAAVLFLALIIFQVQSGAYMAGYHAGMIYNTWPLMEGEFIPGDIYPVQPDGASRLMGGLNDVKTIQFDHRMVAYSIGLAGLGLWAWARRKGVTGWTVVLVAILAQIALGIWTLLMVTPMALAALHQFGALVLFAVAVWATHKAAKA